MQHPDAKAPRLPLTPRTALVAVLAFWVACALAFVVLPTEAGRYVAANAAYAAGGVFALGLLGRAALVRGGVERAFWGLLCGGVAVWLLADLGWSGLQGGALGPQGLTIQHAAYLLAYLLFVCALVRLVSLATRGIAPVTVLDAAAVALSVGVLVWFFFAEGAVGGTVGPGVLAVVSWAPLDAAILYLCLVALSPEESPPFVGSLAAGFLAFAAADLLYLVQSAAGSYGSAGWSDLLWALGMVFLGSAALRAAPVGGTEGQGIAPWRVLAFWLGPLSPPLHMILVLLWAASAPPVPGYVLVCAAVLFAYMGVRVAFVSFVTRRLTEEREASAREAEQGRLLYEMHDTVKQGIHGVTLSVGAAIEHERRGEPEAAREALAWALEAAREAEFRISRPYEDVQADLHARGPEPSPGEFLISRLRRFEGYFGVKGHADLRAPLEDLRPEEIAAANRIFVEACWNVAKHARAQNLYLETRRVGSTFLFRVRDDGRGFDAANPPSGLGLRYMRKRAAEVGAELDVISAPGRGTTVQVRFDRR